MSIELADYQDIIQPFLIHHSNVRGRVVRLGNAVDAIISQHSYPPAVSHLLAEMCVLVSMLSVKLKGRGKLTMQLRGDGDIEFMVADITADGALRGYAELKEGAVFEEAERGLQALVGKGYLAITLQKGKTPYQGIVELDGETISDSMQHYFTNSEQSVVYVKTAIGQREHNGEAVWCAGGLMIQQVPKEGGKNQEGDENRPPPEEHGQSLSEEWSHNRILAETVKDEELLDVYLSPQALLYRLFNEDGVWVYDPESFRAECSCSREKVMTTLAQFPKEELEDMLDEGALKVNCQFCNSTEKFVLDDFA